MDHDVIDNKLESLIRCIERIQSKKPATIDDLMENLDMQDIIILNLERAIQLAVDTGLHILSRSGADTPNTMSEVFITLNTLGVLEHETALRLAKSVGFRNIAVHEYRRIDWNIVYHIINAGLEDFRVFVRSVMEWKRIV